MQLIIDKDRHLITLDSKEFDLTKKEFDILLFLSEQPQKFFTRKILFEKLWGENTLTDEKTVDVHIALLRKKLGSNLIKTKRGVGYCLNNNNILILPDQNP